MAKCAICKSKKGKRKCKAGDAFICSLCCGQSRVPEKCGDCSYYKDPALRRNYKKIPFYGTQQMSGSPEREKIGNTIESMVCKLEAESKESFRDSAAIKLMELCFDKFHFKDAEIKFSDATQRDQFRQMLEAIEQDLPNAPEERLIKVMSARSIDQCREGRLASMNTCGSLKSGCKGGTGRQNYVP